MTWDFPIDEFERQETPFYWYDTDLLRQTIAAVKKCLKPSWHMHYAVKANFNPRILHEFASAGFGADCVSGGEVEAAFEAGFAPEDIVFAGVGKSDREIRRALEIGIGCFNAESIPELEAINELAAQKGVVARVALRVNPNIGAHTHANITTGLAENKFGIPYEGIPAVIKALEALPNVKCTGLHFHIGSQILDMTDFKALCNRVNEVQDQLRKALGIRLDNINVGGGLGIDYYHPNHHCIPGFEGYFKTFSDNLLLHPGQQLHFELGRALVAQCGSLISRVIYIKEGTHKKFAIIDASMTELIRPALYHAYHRVENVTAELRRGQCTDTENYDVVGPVCESSDVFGMAVPLPETRRGDLIALRSAGAYGEAMASRYNLHRLPESLFK